VDESETDSANERAPPGALSFSPTQAAHRPERRRTGAGRAAVRRRRRV